MITRAFFTFQLHFKISLDFLYIRYYNYGIFYERTVNTMTNKFYFSKMPELNIILCKHGVCPICSAMC